MALIRGGKHIENSKAIYGGMARTNLDMDLLRTLVTVRETGSPRHGTDILIISGLGTCQDPARPAAALFYNGDAKIMQYCDGVNWVPIGGDACKRTGVTPGTQCRDGSYHIGDSPEDGLPVYMTSVDYETTSRWDEDPPCYRCGLGDTGATSVTDGRANVEALRAYSGDNATAGNLDGFGAAKYCDELTAHGYSDWYLPAGHTKHNLILLMVQAHGGESVGGRNVTGGTYWASHENNTSNARAQRLSDGLQSASVKNTNFRIRCVRR